MNNNHKETKKTLDNLLNFKSAVYGMNEAVAMKQKEVDYWKRKAYILANKYGTCPDHDKVERIYILQEYVKIVDCRECDLQYKEKSLNCRSWKIKNY